MAGPPSKKTMSVPVHRELRPRRRALPVFGRGRPSRPSRQLPFEEHELEVFIALTNPAAHRVAMKMCGDCEQSFDYTQEMFARVCKRWDKTGNQEVWTMPYLIATLRNVVIEDWRRQQREKVALGVREDEPDLSELPSEESFEWAMQLSDNAREALEQLTPRQRSVVELVVFRGLTPAEAANELKLDRETIYTYRRIAFRKLREVLSRKNT